MMLDALFGRDVQDPRLRRLFILSERTIEEELRTAADNSEKNRNVACTPRFTVKPPERPPRASNKRYESCLGFDCGGNERVPG